MPGKKRSRLIGFSLIGIAILSIGLSLFFWVKSQRASLQDIKIGYPAWRVRFSKAFSYNPNGHFDKRTQYLSVQPDKNSGDYCVHCQQGKITNIFIKYKEPIREEQSMQTLQRLAGEGRISQSDLSELSQTTKTADSSPTADSSQLEITQNLQQSGNAIKLYCHPAEYFYFDNGIAAELDFVSTTDRRVTDLIVFGKQKVS